VSIWGLYIGEWSHNPIINTRTDQPPTPSEKLMPLQNSWLSWTQMHLSHIHGLLHWLLLVSKCWSNVFWSVLHNTEVTKHGEWWYAMSSDCKLNKSVERWRQEYGTEAPLLVLGCIMQLKSRSQKVPGSSGILWLKINKAIFIFNISTLSSSDYMSFSFVYHVDCIILSFVSSAKCVCPGKHGSNIIHVESFATAAPTAPNYIISFRWILDY